MLRVSYIINRTQYCFDLKKLKEGKEENKFVQILFLKL